MSSAARPHIVLLAVGAALLAACTATGGGTPRPSPHPPSSSQAHLRSGAQSHQAHPVPGSSSPGTDPQRRPAGVFTIAFAGDVHFAGRVAARLSRNPATVFAQAAPGLGRADLTMVNLETAITTGGVRQDKEFTFRAPPTALTALRDAGVDVATMANNHGADFGMSGLRDSLRAIRQSGFPVIGIGRNATQAFARVAIIAADQVQDETTLSLFSAGAHKPGVANAYSPRLISAVRRAKAAGYVVVVYVHWGIEYQTCPSSDQTRLAGELARAGATAVVGTHAHVLQGAGWLRAAGGGRSGRGTYVAYGLGNYLWWMSFGNDQDDNGVLTLTFRRSRVVADAFAPSHLDERGVPMPARGAQRQRIMAEWNADRRCTDLSPRPPR